MDPHDVERLCEALSSSPDAPMADLARALGVSRATLHRRYPQRAQLVQALAGAAVAAMAGALDDARLDAVPDAQAPAALVRALVPLGARFAWLLREGDRIAELPGVREEVDALQERVLRVVDRGRRSGAWRPDLPSAYAARLVLAAVTTAWEGTVNGEIGRGQAADLAVDLLERGLRRTT